MWRVVNSRGIELPFKFHHSPLIKWQIVIIIVKYFVSQHFLFKGINLKQVIKGDNYQRSKTNQKLKEKYFGVGDWLLLFLANEINRVDS